MTTNLLAGNPPLHQLIHSKQESGYAVKKSIEIFRKITATCEEHTREFLDRRRGITKTPEPEVKTPAQEPEMTLG